MYVPEGWNGYRWWMAMTPLAYFDESLENPSILVSRDGNNWIVPNGLRNPIDRAYVPTYHSDPDLVLHEGVMYCFYRISEGPTSIVRVRSSTDGVHWSPLTIISEESGWTSLSVIVHQGVWHAFHVQNVGLARTIAHRTAPSPYGPWSAAELGVLHGKPENRNPWHLDVVRHDGKWLAIILEVGGMSTGTDGRILAATSIDGVEWWCGSHLLNPQPGSWDDESLYRPSMYVQGNFAHVYYGGNRTQREGEPRGSWWIGRAAPIPLNRWPQPGTV